MQNGAAIAMNRLFQPGDSHVDKTGCDSESKDVVEVDLARNDSDSKNSKTNDSGIEVKDSFNEHDVRSKSRHKSPRSSSRDRHYRKKGADVVDGVDDDVFDSADAGRPPVAALQEVEVQIEETARQNRLPSVVVETGPEGVDMEHVVMRSESDSCPCLLYRRIGFLCWLLCYCISISLKSVMLFVFRMNVVLQ